MSVDVALDNIRIKEFPTLNFAGGVGVDLDLDNIRFKELPEIKFGGGLDFKLDDIRLKELAPINLAITDLPKIEVDSSSRLDTDSRIETKNQVDTNSKLDLKSDSKLDIGLDDIRIKELPLLDFRFGLRPMKFHLPINYRFCIKLFGQRVFEFETCGEGMFISKDYKDKGSDSCA